ncbi:MAG: repair protein SbcC/Rad50 [Gemmatimonadales bacterium]|nr:repair protein SbcC/Rad50 [Gemmatimonadales bacterium]
MRIDRLRLQNFRQHENTEIEFGPGLTGIIGPNGAGKTTLLEAIAWAMYGMPAARGSRETLRRRGASPKARVAVELDFTLGAHRYRIVRSLNNAELYQDGDPSAIANSIGAVTERVTRLLAMTREQFFNTYFTGQKELAVMAAMSAPERAQFLSQVLGYERLRIGQERLKERRSSLRARLEGLRAGLPDGVELDAARKQADDRLEAAGRAETAAATASEAAEQRLAAIRPQWENLQHLREAAMALEAEIKLADQKAVATSERLARLEHDAAEAASARQKLDEVRRRLTPLPTLREEAQALERQAEAYAARKSYQAQLEEVRAHLASIQERISRVPSKQLLDEALERVNAGRASLTAASLESEEQRTVWVRDAQDAKTKRQGLLDHYQELKEQRQRIVKAGVEGVCPTCARPLGVEYAKVLELLDRQIEEVRSNGNFYKQRIDQLQQEPAPLADVDQRKLVLERELSEATAQVGRLHAQAHEAGPLREEQQRLLLRVAELEGALEGLADSYDQARHEAVIRETRTLEPLALQAERFRVVAERSEAVALELQGARAAVAEIAGAIADLRTRLGGLGYSETTFKNFRDAEQAAERARREAELATVRAKAEHSAAVEAVEAVIRRQAERDERERAATETAGELALHQELDRALTDLRDDLNSSLRPDLSDLASGFLSDLTHGRYVELELDEDYSATVLDDGDPQTVISGGEEDVANLAFRLAISQMIAELAGQPLSLLILDEIFGSLDDAHRSAVTDLLRSLADRFSQVILVTHIESLRESVDHVVRVGFDQATGVATVRDEQQGDRDVAA